MMRGCLVVICVCGLVLLVAPSRAQEEEAMPEQAGPEEVAPEEAVPAEVRKDRLGDPLPAGSVSRIGTLRFRSDATYTALASSPDGAWMAALTEGGAIELWDMGRGTRSVELNVGEEDRAHALVFSPDSKQLAAATNLGVARWGLPDGEALELLPGVDKPTRALAWGPRGRVMASGGDDKVIQLWDLDSGQATGSLEGHEGAISALAFDDKAQNLYSASQDGTWRQWSLRKNREVRSVLAHQGGPVFAMALHPGGQTLATSGNDNHVRLWETRRGKPRGAMMTREGAPTSLVFAPGGRTLAGTSALTPVRIWDAGSGRSLHDLKSVRAQAVAYSEDGQRLFAAGRGLYQWDVSSGTDLLSSLGHKGPVQALAFGPLGNKLASGGEDGQTFVWEAATGYQLGELKGRREVRGLSFSGDGALLVIASAEAELRLHDMIKGAEQRLAGNRRDITAMALSPRGDLLATGDEDAAIVFFDLASKRQVRTFLGDSGFARALDFSNDGRMLASALHQNWFGDERESAVVWHTGNGSLLFRLPFDAPVLDLAFSPDSQRLATVHDSGKVYLYDVTTSQRIAELEGHSGRVQAVVFSPDGRLLATAGEDKIIRLWDLATGQERQAFEGHAAQIQALAFSPDGQRLASASADATVLVWDTSAL